MLRPFGRGGENGFAEEGGGLLVQVRGEGDGDESSVRGAVRAGGVFVEDWEEAEGGVEAG